MKKSILLARSNLRGTKGQTISIVGLILFAAMMLNIWLILATDYKQNFDYYHDKLNAEHVVFVLSGAPGEAEDFLSETVQKDSRTEEFYINDSMEMVGVFAYNGGELNTEMVFLEKEQALNRPVGRVEIVEDSELTSGIYLPMLYRSEEIAVGKTIELSIGGNKISYPVCGFFNSVMGGSHNCGLCEILLTEDRYQELLQKGYAPEAAMLSIRLKEKGESQNYEAELKNKISARYPEVRSVSTTYALVSQSRYISQMICAGIVSAMAFLVLLIALVVISSNMLNYIQENMKNLGALKAVGYTGRQLVGGLLVQFLGITLLAAVLGIALSYLLFPQVNDMMTAQTGIPYTVRLLVLPCLATLGILGGAVALTVWWSAGRIRKIEPIVALRQGVQNHNFRRNRILLERTKAPLNLALALKTTCAGVKQNVTVSITMLGLSLIVVFSGVMTVNMIADRTPFLNLIVGETADSCIDIWPDMEEEFLKALKEDERVEKVYLYSSLNVRHVGGLELMATLSDDFSKVNNPSVCVEGRFPKYDNEAAVAAKYAREKGLTIGDEITLAAGDGEAEYIISGFTQISNNLGKDCLLTRAGYERMGKLQHISYYLNLSEETDIDDFHEEIEARYSGHINVVINIASVIEASASVYVSLMTIIVIAILMLSVIVIAFVLYLLVRTMLNRKKHDYGILKALGFTTGQLILQTALSFLPAVVISTAVGLMVSSLIINPLIAVFLNGIGIVKCTFAVPLGYVAVSGVVLAALSFAIACLLSLRIRKIVPRALLAGE